jgi:hypothetical protein
MSLSQIRPAGQRAARAERAGSIQPGDALEAFGSEQDAPDALPAALMPVPEPIPQPVRTGLPIPAITQAGPQVPLAVAAMAGILVGALGMWGLHRFSAGRAPATLTIETSTPGIDVLVSGKTVGRTPVSLTLTPGVYPVQLAGPTGKREFNVALAGGASVTRQFDLPAAPTPAADDTSGSLVVQTDPDKLTVVVDGAERGTSPLTLTGLKPGEHQVAVRAAGSTLRRTVTVVANERTVLLVSPTERAAPPPPAAAAGGWLTVASPVAITIREAGKIIGTTESDRLMLPAGEHSLELVNDGLAFSAKRAVKIEAGKTAVVKLDPPNGLLNINAQPWAEVWVDGQRVGETPIGNLSRPVGAHEVVLRHPEFGERRETVMVTLKQPARLGVDMRRK